jgi:hypothetical protein
MVFLGKSGNRSIIGVNMDGFALQNQFFLNGFLSLEEAKQQIDKWIAKPKYHKYP